MARSHGRIHSSIWLDQDFIALDVAAQRMYLFLLSQSDLSHAGLLPLRARRWSKKGGGETLKSTEAALETLAEARFIVMDEDTEEVLIRTLVRNDGVYKQPKVMLRLREDAKEIESPALRAAFAEELTRIPLGELKDEGTGPHGDGPSTRQVIAEIIAGIMSDFDEEYTNERVSGRVSDTPRVGARAFPQPPTPSPHPPSPALTSISSEIADATSRPDERPEIDQILDYLDERIEANGAKKPSRNKKARDSVRLMIDRDGRTVEGIYAAIEFATGHEFWRSNILSAPKLRQQYDALSLQAQRGGWKPRDRHQRNADFWETEMAQAQAITETTNNDRREIEAS